MPARVVRSGRVRQPACETYGLQAPDNVPERLDEAVEIAFQHVDVRRDPQSTDLPDLAKLHMYPVVLSELTAALFRFISGRCCG